MDFEDILIEVGDYGYYQKRLVYMFLVPSATILPLLCMTTIFMVSSPDHWCKVPQFTNYSFERQRELISPLIEKNGIITYDSCHMYDIDYNYLAKVGNITIYMNDKYLNESLKTKACDNGWVYDNIYYDETAVTALNLVCDRNYYASMVLSIGAIGTVIGTPIFGWLSDKIGRRKTFYVTLFVSMFSMISPTILRDLSSFIVFRVINGLILPSFYQIPYIILIEIVGPSARTAMNGIACVTWVIGFSALPFIAYITRDWVIFNIVTSSTIFLFIFFYKLLPESPRWLIINDKYSEAEIQLLEMAKVNQKPKPKGLKEKLRKVGKKLNEDKSEEDTNAILLFIKKPGLRRNFFLVTFNWISCFVAYSGIHFNIYNFHGNQFINFFLLGIIEIPSYLTAWYCMETRLGRRWSNALFMLLCGISLCIPVITPKSYTTLINLVTLIGKFSVSVSFMIIYQQAAEIYPTPIRNQGMGVGSMVSALVNIGLPYLAYLGQYGVWIPLVIMGSLSIVNGLISTLIPETLNENLPQTVEEGNIFGKNQIYFSWAKTKPKNIENDKQPKKDLFTKETEDLN